MGKYNKGILGGFSGKVGNVIGSSWKGIDYMRSIPNSTADAKTDAQMAQRNKFAMVNALLRKLAPVIKMGFTNNKRMTAINSAMSYNLKNAVTGSYPDQQIDFASLAVARGDLIPASESTAESTSPSQVNFSWTDNSEVGSAQPDDKALLVVFNPAKERAVFIPGTGPERGDESYDLVLPGSYAGDTVEVYIAFVSADGLESSDSTYLGSVAVAEVP